MAIQLNVGKCTALKGDLWYHIPHNTVTGTISLESLINLGSLSESVGAQVYMKDNFCHLRNRPWVVCPCPRHTSTHEPLKSTSLKQATKCILSWNPSGWKESLSSPSRPRNTFGRWSHVWFKLSPHCSPIKNSANSHFMPFQSDGSNSLPATVGMHDLSTSGGITEFFKPWHLLSLPDPP